jgi:AraC-like DNA-binding protein
MLTQREGTAEAIRRLLSETVIPALENGARSYRIILAEGHEPAARPALAGGRRAAHRRRPDVANLERHDFPELCICLSGVAEIQASGTCRRLERGHILIVPAGVSHSTGVLHAVVSRPETISSRLLWLGIFPYGAVVNLCESLNGLHQSTPRQLLLERHIYPHIQELVLELKHADYRYELLARCSLLQALTHVCRGLSVTEAEGKFTTMGAPRPVESDDNIVGRARRYVHHNFDSNLDLDTITSAVSANKAHLCRAFKRDTGLTVMDYLARVRIDAGKRLLLTSLKVSAIAQLVGYDDPYYFSRVFKKLTGLSPSEFRDQHRHDLAD